jgi:signal transduction histidine kinase
MGWLYVLPLVVAATISITLVWVVWSQRSTVGELTAPFSALALASAFWAFVYAIELVNGDPSTKFVWTRIRYVGIDMAPVAWLAFAAQLAGRGKWLSRRNLILLCVIPVISILLMWTNPWHGLMWASFQLAYVGPLTVFDTHYGPWFWVSWAYAYALLFSGSVLLLRTFLRLPQTYRSQLSVLLLAVVAPWISNALTVMGVTRVDFTPFAFAISGLGFFWGILRLQLFDVIPVARDTVIESLSDGVLVLDAQNRLVDYNPAAWRLLGHKTPKLIGQPAAHLLPALDGRIPDKAEITLPIGAEEHFFELSSSPLYSQSRRLHGHVVILHDITERRQAEQKIRAQNEALIKANRELEVARQQAVEATRLKNQFLATMSHELRTPLNAIIGYTEIQLAGMTGALNDEQHNYQARVLANAEHLLQLINEVLDLSKIEAGRMELIQKPFAIKAWLDEIVAQMQGLADQKGLYFEVGLGQTMPDTITGDCARLKQIAINLLSNAIKFTDKGFVRIEIRRQGLDAWQLEVSDSGIGIPSHLQETIFQEFRQVDASSRRAHGGTGLGLAIVRRLALMMGGSVRLKSQSGEGSTFTVTVPLIGTHEPLGLAGSKTESSTKNDHNSDE